MIMVKIKDVLKFSMAYIFSIIFKLFSPHKNIWIITERRSECKDNGYYLFKYIRENHPEINVYFAIEKSSSQISKIEKLGNIIYFNSFKHYVFALSATKLIGAFLPCGIPDSMCFYKFDRLIKAKKYYIKHGIVKESLPTHHYENTHVDLYICGAKPEYDYVSKNFNYPKNHVKYTGLCRYDGLLDFNAKKIIFLMPTWRKWIPSATWHEKDGFPDISNIEYFEMYKNLINDKNLISLIKSHGYKLIFYIHHEMQPYISYFGESNDIVTIASENDYDVQDLLKSSSCLITDYSSVAFDFAYMKKPLIYYQFDEDEYYKNHYNKGYFDYGDMGFGPKCSNINQLVLEIKRILENDCDMSEIYKKRVDNFFVYRDKKNCERNYEAILNEK